MRISFHPLRGSLLPVALAAALPAALAAQTVHHIKTVFVIVMENHNWTGSSASNNIAGNPAAPYINYTLIPQASYARNYNNPPGIHPSLPNYLWLEAGDTLGVRDDGSPQQHTQSTTNHLTTLLQKAGISWRAYEESISSADCPLNPEGAYDSNGNHLYAPRHDPFVYFDDVTNTLNTRSTNCISHIRPFSQLVTDLANNTVARYNFITPNLCDDMHDPCSGNEITHGDTWLKEHVPAILSSTAYRSGGALFIVWDEAATGNGPIPMIVLSPYARGNHYSNGLYYTHSSMLRTFQEIFGVYPYIRYASGARDLSDLFSVFP
jgi:phosphatidylinositol-3-phosphatase